MIAFKGLKHTSVHLAVGLLVISLVLLGCKDNKKNQEQAQGGQEKVTAVEDQGSGQPEEKTPDSGTTPDEGGTTPTGEVSDTPSQETESTGEGKGDISKTDKPPKVDEAEGKKPPTTGNGGSPPAGNGGGTQPPNQGGGAGAPPPSTPAQPVTVSGSPPWVEPGQKLAVIFPKLSTSGSTFIVRDQKNNLSLEGAQTKDKFKFDPKAKPADDYVATKKTRGGDTLEFATKPPGGIPMADIIPGQYRKKDGSITKFYIIRPNNVDPAKISSAGAEWGQLAKASGWVAYLMTPRFADHVQPRTANVTIEDRGGGEIHFVMTPTGENQPFVDGIRTDDPAKRGSLPKAQYKQGVDDVRVTRFRPEGMPPIFVGRVIRAGGLPDIFFVGLPTEGAA